MRKKAVSDEPSAHNSICSMQNRLQDVRRGFLESGLLRYEQSDPDRARLERIMEEGIRHTFATIKDAHLARELCYSAVEDHLDAEAENGWADGIGCIVGEEFRPLPLPKQGALAAILSELEENGRLRLYVHPLYGEHVPCGEVMLDALNLPDAPHSDILLWTEWTKRGEVLLVFSDGTSKLSFEWNSIAQLPDGFGLWAW